MNRAPGTTMTVSYCIERQVMGLGSKATTFNFDFQCDETRLRRLRAKVDEADNNPHALLP
jgi:hypothetical protein